MEPTLRARRDEVLALTKYDPDPKVRHRAHALLAMLACASITDAAAQVAVSPKSLGRWRDRFLADGRDGLRDRPRSGRPAKLPAEARTLLETALEGDPGDYGYPVATWTMADLADLFERRGWSVSAATVNRTVHALGYVHRRPRHDLRHRQDVEAVASAKRVLDALQKKGLISPADCDCFTLTSANFTPIPTWRKPGDDAERPGAFPPPEPTGA